MTDDVCERIDNNRKEDNKKKRVERRFRIIYKMIADASTREQKNGVFEKFHFEDRLRKVPCSVTVSTSKCGRKVNP